MADIVLPSLGESIADGTVNSWLKSVGDHFELDEPLLEVSTDKVDTEVPAPFSGTLLEIKANEGDTVDVGTVLAIVEVDESPMDDTSPLASAEPLTEEPSPGRQIAQTIPVASIAPSPPGGTQESHTSSRFLSPLVRRLASEHQIDFTSLQGRGLNGRVTKHDILAHLPAVPTDPTLGAVPPLTPTMGAQGTHLTPNSAQMLPIHPQKLAESPQTATQVTAMVEVDMTKIVKLVNQHRNSFPDREGVDFTLCSILARSSIDALRQARALNARLDTERKKIVTVGQVHLAFEVDTQANAVAPVINNAGDLSTGGLAVRMARHATAVDDGTITLDNLHGATFTISDHSSHGTLLDTPIISPNHLVILSTGAIVKRPVVIDDPTNGEMIAIRHMATLALAYDQRLVNSAGAARFLNAVKQRLQTAQFDL